MLLQFRKDGIYCEQAGVYIDPWIPVDRAIITHAHSDHARWGHKYYLAHDDSKQILKYRLGQDINIETLGFNKNISINNVNISFHPAGHITGSAQVRLEYKGEVWVVSGDYKIKPDGINPPFEAITCDHFVTESTFGLPVYNFPETSEVYSSLREWCNKNIISGKSAVIAGYSLGKAQRILDCIRGIDAPVVLHGAIYNTNEALGFNNEHFTRYQPGIRKILNRNLVMVIPSSAPGSPWLRQFEPYELAICSGWMQLRGERRRRNADAGFIMSDHADWKDLNMAVKATGAQNIYVTHGYKTAFARWLNEELNLNAVTVDTLFEGENIEKEIKTVSEEEEAE
jgi:putative mRNA 3-end processing factor